MRPNAPAVFEYLDMLEWHLCRRLGRYNLYRPWLTTLRLASGLGDWPAWVALIAALPLLHPEAGWRYLLQYSLTALIAIGVYRLLKTRLCRERPFITFVGNVSRQAPARDRYSFPSGHTMHAVMFLTLTSSHLPWLSPWLVPVVILIALSRVGLGLHYVSDVLAGGLIGMLFAWGSLAFAG
ncbi:phosphatase PAP2 family protein [Halomonas icarae]|uniref:undecaprenyl-diphosphate phosphatase n=1 Tax=Halomonas icarae TaxID=2691040 RepID=A0A7X4VXQ5_9GAMM|nr:phosphatase PAP2 family protein [Halomonas icarae]MDR5902322.1 phosphatase PAP2 family protein [Halomonas icarae]NAW12131.1 phosphatase PAP2 family protein [Halomonas icarae]